MNKVIEWLIDKMSDGLCNLLLFTFIIVIAYGLLWALKWAGLGIFNLFGA